MTGGIRSVLNNANIQGIGAGNNQQPVKPVVNPGESTKVNPGKKVSPAECQTCKSRKYQDGSDEGNVSFKTAQHVNPAAAGAAVRAHEGQHVSNAYKKAAEGNGKVLQASVRIHTSICPECGRTYVSGGVTSTKIKYGQDDKKNPNAAVTGIGMDQRNKEAAMLLGMNLNTGV